MARCLAERAQSRTFGQCLHSLNPSACLLVCKQKTFTKIFKKLLCLSTSIEQTCEYKYVCVCICVCQSVYMYVPVILDVCKYVCVVDLASAKSPPNLMGSKQASSKSEVITPRQRNTIELKIRQLIYALFMKLQSHSSNENLKRISHDHLFGGFLGGSLSLRCQHCRCFC